MANSPQARKRARLNEIQRKHNAGQRSRARTYIKKVETELRNGNAEAARNAFREMEPVIDNSVNKGAMTKNKVARHKSRLNARIKALQTA